LQKIQAKTRGSNQPMAKCHCLHMAFVEAINAPKSCVAQDEVASLSGGIQKSFLKIN